MLSGLEVQIALGRVRVPFFFRSPHRVRAQECPAYQSVLPSSTLVADPILGQAWTLNRPG